ncbi:MAG: type IX secretion system membrane protein PorP/SprF [Bacteroidales bacterium]|jgi:type IX secretion system PorP/SprF family membrane protein|nr:type IX secretion system membrane protein PorP/SprF [Bacteroidales bacterium]
MIKWLKIIAFSVSIILVVEAKSQQEQSFTQFMFQQAVFNPAVNGNEPNIQLNGLMRQQWIGLSGAPETFFVNIHAPVSFLKGGVGATIINDKIGAFTSTGLKLAYAYRTNFWQGKLSLGVSAGLINKAINYSYFNIQNDPLLVGSSEESGMIFNVDIGVYYEEKDHYYFGVSSTQFNQGSMNIEGGQTSLKRNVYIHGGYFFALRQIPHIVFHPSAMTVYTVGAPIQINLGITGEYNKKFWGGVIYKHQSGIGLLAGIYYRQFSAGYAYEINTTPLRNGGSHELMIGYRFLIEVIKGNKSYKNTRYL